MWEDWPGETCNKEWRENRWSQRPSWKYEIRQLTDKGGHFADRCDTGMHLRSQKISHETLGSHINQRNPEFARTWDSPTAVVSNISVTIQKRLTLALYTVNSTKIARVYLSTQMLSKRCWSKLWTGNSHICIWQFWIKLNQLWCKSLSKNIQWELVQLQYWDFVKFSLEFIPQYCWVLDADWSEGIDKFNSTAQAVAFILIHYLPCYYIKYQVKQGLFWQMLHVNRALKKSSCCMAMLI